MHDTRCWRHHNMHADCTCDEWRRLDRDKAIEDELRNLMQVCYDEANRLANHCSDGAAKWAENNLYEAAQHAKAVLSQNSQLTQPKAPCT